MRWLFYDPSDPAEARYHEETLDRIASWWAAFDERREDLEARLAGTKRWDIPGWVRHNLKPIDRSLKWEVGPGIQEASRFTITPESRRDLRPLVEEILMRAPIVPGWEFAGSRASASLETVFGMVKKRVNLDLARARARVAIGEYRGVRLSFDLGLAEPCPRSSALTAAYLAAEYLVGEDVLDTWVEGLEVVEGGTGRFLPLDKLQDRVASAVAALEEQRPRDPFAARHESRGGVVLRMPESHARKLAERDRGEEDFPRRTDILVATTPDPSLWKCAHSGRRFYSERYSRLGERFCYLKVDEGAPDQGRLEATLDETVREQGLGCVIGSGRGQRYTYVDLALTELRKGLEAVRARLQDCELPKRSWILFLDSSLRGEWVGVHADTPPPPL